MSTVCALLYPQSIVPWVMSVLAHTVMPLTAASAQIWCPDQHSIRWQPDKCTSKMPCSLGWLFIYLLHTNLLTLPKKWGEAPVALLADSPCWILPAMGTPCPILAALVAAEVMEWMQRGSSVFMGRPSSPPQWARSANHVCECQQCGAPVGDPGGTMEREHEMESSVKNRMEENFKDKFERIWDIFLAAQKNSWDPQKILDLSQ